MAIRGASGGEPADDAERENGKERRAADRFPVDDLLVGFERADLIAVPGFLVFGEHA